MNFFIEESFLFISLVIIYIILKDALAQ